MSAKVLGLPSSWNGTAWLAFHLAQTLANDICQWERSKCKLNRKHLYFHCISNCQMFLQLPEVTQFLFLFLLLKFSFTSLKHQIKAVADIHFFIGRYFNSLVSILLRKKETGTRSTKLAFWNLHTLHVVEFYRTLYKQSFPTDSYPSYANKSSRHAPLPDEFEWKHSKKEFSRVWLEHTLGSPAQVSLDCTHITLSTEQNRLQGKK